MNLVTNGAYSSISVAEYVQLLREKSGLSQCDFASRVGISPAMQSMIESGKRLPSADVMIELLQQTKYAYFA